MGETFFRESFSETKSGKRVTYFETEPSRGLYLERFFWRARGSKNERGTRSVVVRPRSYFWPAGRFSKPKKFTERVRRTTLSFSRVINAVFD